MSFFIGTDDQTCPEDVALQYIDQMKTETSIIEVEGEGHSFFANPAVDLKFMGQLLLELIK